MTAAWPVQGRQLLPRARSRAAGGADVGRRQPPRDAERAASPRIPATSSSLSTSQSTPAAWQEPIPGSSASASVRSSRPSRSPIRDDPPTTMPFASHLISPHRAARRAVAGRATVVEREPRLDAPLATAEAAVRINRPEEVTAVRTMHKRIGLDPTKTRPSSEALLRRVRKGDPLPRINSMVDVCNWCSLEFQLPYGLYDAAHIDGDVELRWGCGRVVSGHPQGRRQRGRPDYAGRREAVRQPHVGFGADDGDDRHDARLVVVSRRATSTGS